MRQDQYERLQKLAEQLTEVFLGEADSRKWPGEGIEPGAMDRDTRGDRYWCKKNAAATIALVIRTHSLVGTIQASGQGTTPPAPEEEKAESDLDRDVKACEAEGMALLERIQKAARGG